MPALIRTAVCLLSYALAHSAFAATPGRSAEPSGQYLKEWLLCGPFPALTEAEQDIDAIRLPGMYTDLLQDQGGEGEAQPGRRAGGVVPGRFLRRGTPCLAGECGQPRCRHHQDRPRGGLRVLQIDSPKQQACILALGSNDGVRAWLNGEAVLDCPGPRGLQMDHNLVPVALRQGRNSLLLKIEERGNRWGFACRFLPLSQDTPGRAPAALRGRLARRWHARHPRAPIAGASRRRC